MGRGFRDDEDGLVKNQTYQPLTGRHQDKRKSQRVLALDDNVLRMRQWLLIAHGTCGRDGRETVKRVCDGNYYVGMQAAPEMLER